MCYFQGSLNSPLETENELPEPTGCEAGPARFAAPRSDPVPPVNLTTGFARTGIRYTWRAMAAFFPPALSAIERAAFVGREREMAALAAKLGAAASGHGTVVLIAGEPGVGKTRLMREVAARAQDQGWRVLWGHAYDSEGMPPYLPFAEAIAQQVRRSTDDEGGRQLAEAAPEVALLVPELRGFLPRAVSQPSMGAEADRYRLFEAVSDFFLGFSRVSETTGLLLCLEDIHWADKPTLLLLQHLARKLAGARLLVSGTYRNIELDVRHPLSEVLASLSRDHLYQRVLLDSLSEQEAAKLIDTAAGMVADSTIASGIFRLTNGNPFFVEEVVRHLQAEGHDLAQPARAVSEWGVPEGVKQVIGRRLSHLSPDANLLLQAAATLGSAAFDLTVLTKVTGFDTQIFTEALEEALKAGLVRQTESCGFSHAMVRETVYDDLSLPRRQALHLRTADAIEQLYRSNRDPHLAELAHQYGLAGAGANSIKAIQYATSAGDGASNVFAYEEAARLYLMAIHALQSGEVADGDALLELHLKRATACASLTVWSEARREFEAALPLLAAERKQDRAELLNDLAIACFWAGETSIARQYANEAKTLAERGLSEDIVTSAIAVIGRLQFSDGQIEASVKSYQEAIKRSQGRRLKTVDQLLPAYAHLLYLSGDHQSAIDQALECIEVSRRVNDFSSLVYTLGDLGLSLAASGRYDEALQTLDEAQKVGREHGLTSFLARAAGMMAGPRLDLFDFQAAERLAQVALDLGQSFDFQPTVVSAGIDLLFSYAQMGEVGRAETLLNDVAADAADASDIHGWLWRLRLAQARAQIALARRDWREAIDFAGESSEFSRATRRTKYEVAASVTHGQALLGLGRKRDGIRELHHALEIARPVGDPAMLLRASAAILLAEPEATVASEARAAAGRILDGLSDLEMRQHFEEAEPVRLVLSFGKSRSGVSASHGSAYPKALSDRKIEVLQLIVQGKTNREIADALVLSERTVQRHIADLYRAIDVRNRAEATAFGINQLGLTSG